MNLTQLKEELGLDGLKLHGAINAEGKPTGWLKMWNSENRIQISIHAETMEKILINRNIDCLELQIKEKVSPSTQKSYIDKCIVEKSYEIVLYDDKKFPWIILPDKFLDFLKSSESIIEEELINAVQKPQEPVRPEKPVRPENPSKGLLFAPIIPIFPALFVLMLSRNSLTCMIWTYFILLLLSLIFITYLIVDYYNKELPKFERGTILYPQKLKDFEREKIEYEENIKKYNNQIVEIKQSLENKNYLCKKRIEYISNKQLLDSRRPSIDYSNPIVGRSESTLHACLKKYFEGEILTNKVIEKFTHKIYDNSYGYDDNPIEEERPTYVPDFIFAHNKTPLTIDIEIDEPNSYGKPIHYLGNPHDTKRNEYFTKNGWIVIRFSEEQVQKDSEGCCTEIASLVYHLTGDFTYLKRIGNKPRIYRHKRWTCKEAQHIDREPLPLYNIIL